MIFVSILDLLEVGFRLDMDGLDKILNWVSILDLLEVGFRHLKILIVDESFHVSILDLLEVGFRRRSSYFRPVLVSSFNP